MHDSLVRSVFPGPLDIVADVHGEIDAMHELLKHLGYDRTGPTPKAGGSSFWAI